MAATMVTTPTIRARDPRRGRPAAYWWLHAFALAAVSTAHADLQFVPQVSVGVAHTDNLTLASENEEPQTVYELIPAFTLAQQSPRVTSSAVYRAEGYRYSERDANSVYHILDGNLRVAPDPDNFFIDLGASRDQTTRDPAAPISRSNLPITTNRLNRDRAYFGPAFTYPLGGDASINGSFRRTRVRYDELDTGTSFARDFDLDAATLSLDNHRKERGFTWATRYTMDKTDYDLYRPYEYRQATVELGAWAGRRVRVFGSGGKESAWDVPFDPSLADGFWEVGFATRDDARITAELAAGERSFGSSRRASVTVMFGHGSLQLEHADQPTTQRRNQYRVGQPIPATPEDPQDLLTNPTSAERYLSRLSTATLSFDLRRTTLLLAAFDEARQGRIQLDGTPLPDQQQTSVTLSASRRFGAHTELVLAARTNNRELSVGDRRDFRSTSLTTNYDLGPRTRLSLEYAYTTEDSNGAGLNYTARLVSLLITRTFNNGGRNNAPRTNAPRK
jgi:hypothetical protein